MTLSVYISFLILCLKGLCIPRLRSWPAWNLISIVCSSPAFLYLKTSTFIPLAALGQFAAARRHLILEKLIWFCIIAPETTEPTAWCQLNSCKGVIWGGVMTSVLSSFVFSNGIAACPAGNQLSSSNWMWGPLWKIKNCCLYLQCSSPCISCMVLIWMWY